MTLRTLTIYFVLPVSLLLSSYTIPADGDNAGKCNRKSMEGLYTYLASPTTFVFREANRMTERLGDIGVITEYEIRWSSKISCDHQLVVTKVTTTKITPAEMKPYLLKAGDVLNITVLNVTEEYMSFRTRWKDKVTEERMERIPEKMLLGN